MDIPYINGLIHRIVNREFKTDVERRILNHDGRVNFRCPYCREGNTKSKKRGNLYFDKLIYICFRCDKKTTLDRFCKDFNEQIDPDKKMEMITHLDSVITYSNYGDDFVDAKIENLINLSDLEKTFNSGLSELTEFKPIVKDGGIYKYLIGRGIPPEYHMNIYQAKYWKNEDESEWVIVMLNRRGDKVLGIQVRNLKEDKRRMFKIYNYENLVEIVSNGSIGDEIDMNMMVVYNKLSYYFNILNVDLYDRVTVFEGYIDSMFFPNSIGLVGVNTSTQFLERDELDVQYFYDNDEVGYKKSEEKLRSGDSVFLWQKLFDYIVNNKRSDDPVRLLNRISKVKDINKLSQYASDPYRKFNLQKFFSDDIMDIKWIPKFRKRSREVDEDYNKKFDRFDKI